MNHAIETLRTDHHPRPAIDFRARYYGQQARLRGMLRVEDVDVVRRAQAAAYDRLLEWFPIARDGRTVELACGPGAFLGYLVSRGHGRVEGIEFSDGYLDLCRRQGLPVIQADVRDWFVEQPPASIDTLFAVDFAEHLDRDEVLSFFDASARVLVPGGQLIFRVPCADSPFANLNFRNDITHETMFTTTATGALLRLCGFDLAGIVDDHVMTLATRSLPRRISGKLARAALRTLIRAATGERIEHLGPTMWVVARKPSEAESR